ncbi:MAG: hypothetical protein NTW12_13845 [Deltaproteobacteria bacterium]|nr:hypothetical protein [Deltaproteobacteria bacterium]
MYTLLFAVLRDCDSGIGIGGGGKPDREIEFRVLLNKDMQIE